LGGKPPLIQRYRIWPLLRATDALELDWASVLDPAQSIATIHRALDLGVNLLDTSASYGQGHNHRLIGEAIRGHRHDVVIHSKSGSPRWQPRRGARRR
jgi:aryl-alcohol dehydrogenase-like predicted oxidoreductase